MAISIQCSSCGRSYRVKDELAGRKARCQDCGSAIQIPAASSVSAKEAEVISPPPERAKEKAPEPSPISSPARQKPLSEVKKPPEDVKPHVEKNTAGAPKKRSRTLLVVLTIVLLGLVRFSVRRYLSDQPGGTGNGSSATTARDFSNWVSYEAPDKSFQIRLPATPHVKSNEKLGQVTTYRCTGTDLIVEISTAPIGYSFADPDDQNAALDRIAEELRKDLLRHSPGFGEARLEYLGVQAREFSIDVAQGPATKRLFLSHKMYFGIQCIRIGKDKSASWASQNEVLGSMRITRPEEPDVGNPALNALLSMARNQLSTSESDSQVRKTDVPSEPFLQRRAGFRTKLIRQGPSPQEWKTESPPEGVTEITYPSGDLQLKAWIARPSGSGEEKHPALVYFHGGFAFGAEDFEVCRNFLKEGFVVMTPILRGENGNPGDFELFFGEVNDGCAAVRWLAEQPDVKRDQIYAFGHSAGGGITTMLSLFEDLPLRHCGSAGGLYTAETLKDWTNLIPFDTSDPEEFRQRVLIGNLRDMKRSHFAYLGADDTITASAIQDTIREVGADSMLMIRRLPGDHFTSLLPAAEGYLKDCGEDIRSLQVNEASKRPIESETTTEKSGTSGDPNVKFERAKLAAIRESTAERSQDRGAKAAAYLDAAELRFEANEMEKAAENLRLALEFGPDDRPLAKWHSNVSRVQKALGQYSESVDSLQKSLKLTTDQTERFMIQQRIDDIRKLSRSVPGGKP